MSISISNSQPEHVHRELAELFNRRDLEGLLALYEDTATLVPQPGASVSGTRALREALTGFLALAPERTYVETLAVVRAGDLALTRSHWGLTGKSPSDGAAITLEHYGVEIMRRQADGSWRFVVDDPFAGDATAPTVSGAPR
jgi:uncharacterized protein (TIGR02246 family)